jgi:hypothetical protein
MSQIAARSQAFQRLHEDQTTYAKHCLKIRDKQGNIVPLVYNKAQLYVHQKLEEQKAKMGFIRAVIMKGRQEGVTTYIESRFFKQTSLSKGVASFILSHEAKSTASIFDMVKRFHDNLPGGMSPGLETANKIFWSRQRVHRRNRGVRGRRPFDDNQITSHVRSCIL